MPVHKDVITKLLHARCCFLNIFASQEWIAKSLIPS